MTESNAGIEATQPREIAFDQWWQLSCYNGTLPKHSKNLAREAYYAAWGGEALSTPAPQVEREAIARALHEAHKPFCDYTYPFEHDMSGRHIYEALADAILALGQATNSPGDAGASHNTGERNPSVMPDSSPGELRETGGVR